MVIAGLLLVALLSLVGTVLALFGPYWLDDRALDRIVMVVALDWRDFGEHEARTRLQLELDKEIGLQVQDSDCTLSTDGEAKVVRCEWDAEVVIPLTEGRVPVAFESEARVASDGTLR